MQEVLGKQGSKGPRVLSEFMLAEHGEDSSFWMEKLEKERSKPSATHSHKTQDPAMASGYY